MSIQTAGFINGAAIVVDAPLRNWEIVMLALQIEGAASRRVHTEDISLRCFDLAPDAFSWLKHPKYPDKEVVRKDLTRLRDGQFGGRFVRGRAGITRRDDAGTTSADGWQLTDDGVKWLIGNQLRLQDQIGHRVVKFTRQDEMRSLRRIREHPLFIRYQENPNAYAPTLGELAEMLRCRVDSDEGVWTARFESARNQANLAGQSILVQFLNQCQDLRLALAKQ